MVTVFNDMNKLFKAEYNLVVEQYNQIRWKLFKTEKEMKKQQEEYEYLENLNSNKDVFYDNMAIRFIDVSEGFEYAEVEDIDISQQQVKDANQMFNQVFEFYGGYA